MFLYESRRETWHTNLKDWECQEYKLMNIKDCENERIYNRDIHADNLYSGTANVRVLTFELHTHRNPEICTHWNQKLLLGCQPGWKCVFDKETSGKICEYESIQNNTHVFKIHYVYMKYMYEHLQKVFLLQNSKEKAIMQYYIIQKCFNVIWLCSKITLYPWEISLKVPQTVIWTFYKISGGVVRKFTK